MNECVSLKMESKVELFALNEDGSLGELLYEGHNVKTFEGADGIAALLSGQVSGAINAMYFGFDADGGASVTATDANTTASDFRALSTPLDFMRIRLSAGVLDASAGDYIGNRITFTGVAPADNDGENGDTMTGGTAEVTHLGLVIAPDFTDNTKDYVFAAHTPVSVIAVPVNTGVAMRWQVTFTQS